MVEINNQRKAFLDMLAWSEGTDNGRQKTRNHGYDGHGRRLFTDYSDHPRKLVTLGKTQINRRRTLASFPLVGCLPQAAWPERLLSEKSGRCGIATDEAWRTMIDRVDNKSGNRPLQQYLEAAAGRELWSSSGIKADSLIANSKKRAERSERLMYEQSHRDYLALVICIIVCLSWAVNHYRDNAITYKAQRDKMPEN